tara:strand:+ start:1685 stop:3478 length:1794 start_codon:yes stop_codon:yes gene_type:complete
MARNNDDIKDDALRASEERLKQAQGFQADLYGMFPQREGFEGETMGITGLNNSLTDLYNTLSMLKEKELQNRAEKNEMAISEGFESHKDKKQQERAEKKEKKDIEKREKNTLKEMIKKGYADKDGNLTEAGKAEKERRQQEFDDKRFEEMEEEEYDQAEENQVSATPMVASPAKYKFNVAALRRGMMGTSNVKSIQAVSSGLNNMYNVFSLMRDQQRKRTEAELSNFNIDEVQSGFDSFNNGTFACGEYLSAQKKELASLKARARKLNPNSPMFAKLKSEMKAVDNRVKQLNGSMQKLQLEKADFADKHGMGDQDKDGRFRYSEATRQSDSYFYMQQVMNKTAPMVIDKGGMIQFEVAMPNGQGMQMMTLEQMQQGIYERDDNGLQYYNTMQDAVDKNHKANMQFDEGAVNAGLGKIFGYNKDVNKKNVMSWIHDFPELGGDGKTFIQHYKEDKLPGAKIAWATKTLEQYKDKIPNYNEIMKDGVSLEEAQALQKSSFEFTGETGITDDMIMLEYDKAYKYFDPDNTADWGQVSDFEMRFSGASNNERTIGEHIRDELKAYYLKRLRARHDKNVNAEIRGSGKDTYTADYDPLNPNN